MSWRPETVRLFNINIHVLDRKMAVMACLDFLQSTGACCPYVVTPNVDHVVKLQNDARFMAAYQGAALVLADGNPVVWVSRLVGKPLPCTVTGSDLVPALLDAWKDCSSRPLKVFLLGAAPGVAETASVRIHERYLGVQVVGWDSPPFAFENDLAENDRIINLIRDTHPDLLVVGLGAPKQEIWVSAHAARLPVRLAICGGAVIDFIAEKKRRAPSWVRLCQIEWLYRLLCEPRRLALRYAHDILVFPWLMVKEVFKQRL